MLYYTTKPEFETSGFTETFTKMIVKVCRNLILTVSLERNPNLL